VPRVVNVPVSDEAAKTVMLPDRAGAELDDDDDDAAADDAPDELPDDPQAAVRARAATAPTRAMGLRDNGSPRDVVVRR
jgi:hypothetical protein